MLLTIVCKNHIEANDAAIDAMRALDPNESIVMLNLLKFRDMALDGFFGSEPIWMGLAKNRVIGDGDWDLAILVRFPARQHFVDKLDNAKYREIAKVLHAALLDSRLVELSQLIPAVWATSLVSEQYGAVFIERLIRGH